MKKIFNLIKRSWYLLLLAVVVTTFFIYRNNQNAINKLKENSYTVKRENIVESLSFSGKVDAYEKASLKFPISGKLNWIKVKEGDLVEKWQSVAGLDPYEAQKNLEKALRDYSSERNDFEEAFRITYREQTPFSALTDTLKRILEKNQWDLEKAVLDVELKNYALKLAVLTTPISGIVTHIDNPVAGVFVAANQSRIDVVNPETIYFSATADQTEVVKLTNGQKGTLVFDSFLDKRLEAVIDSISYLPKNGETGTVYELRINFPKGDNSFSYRLGMTGDVNFILKEKKDVLSIPSGAIQKEGDLIYVEKILNNKKIKTEIVTGEVIDSKTEILSGLASGDIISL